MKDNGIEVLIDHLKNGNRCRYPVSTNLGGNEVRKMWRKKRVQRALAKLGLLKAESGGWTVITEKGRAELAALLAKYADVLQRAGCDDVGAPDRQAFEKAFLRRLGGMDKCAGGAHISGESSTPGRSGKMSVTGLDFGTKKNRDLIAALQKLPPDADVQIDIGGEFRGFAVDHAADMGDSQLVALVMEKGMPEVENLISTGAVLTLLNAAAAMRDLCVLDDAPEDDPVLAAFDAAVAAFPQHLIVKAPAPE